MANIPTNEIHFSGDFTLEKVNIIGVGGNTIDIRPQVTNIEIYETLFYPFITAKIYVQDNIDLINVVPITGEEFVNITASTPSMKNRNKKLDFVFHAYKISDKVKSTDRTDMYTIECISVEAFIDASRKISKAYSGNIAEIAKKILENPDTGLSANKQKIIEPTLNSIQYISNFWSPVNNLVFLADHAVSTDNSPSYIFFENRDGFHFISLERMYKNPAIQEFIKDNFVRGGADRKNPEAEYQRIIELYTDDMFDFYSNINKGVYGSTRHNYDLTLKRYNYKEYLPNSDKDRINLNKDRAFSGNLNTQYANQIESISQYSLFDEERDVSNSNIVQERKYLISSASYHSIRITVKGRSDYTVGYPVQVTIPINAPINKTDSKDATIDTLLSGKYLIAEINHSLNGREHSCTMTLIKNSVGAKK